MRIVVALAVLIPSLASADPSWVDTPALLDAAIAPHADAIRACKTEVPFAIGFYASRTKKGATEVNMPFYGGHRGISDEERCLMAAIAKIQLPPLPSDIERVGLAYTIVAKGDPLAKFEKRFDDWRDPQATISQVIGASERAALGACDTKSRIARLNIDLSKGKTRIWLPAWQFHSDKGDGSTPPAQAKVKACMTKAIRSWTAPVLPKAMGELQIAFTVGG